MSNRTIAEQYADAIEDLGEAKQDALRKRKHADRLLDVFFLDAEGKNKDERMARARTHEKYKEADLEAIEAECKKIAAESDANRLEVLWETWRSERATARAELQTLGGRP